MSTILVIQPYKMLQQAFAVALHGDHQIQVQETIPESSVLKDFDVVIVDAASLAERKRDGELRTVQSWKIPTVWIGSGDAPAAPSRERLISVSRPVHQDALRKAIAECLAPSMGTAEKAQLAPAKAAAKSSKAKVKEKTDLPEIDEPQFIELVEVVEAPSLPEQTKTAQKKK